MSTPFLVRFTEGVLARLQGASLIEVRQGGEAEVVRHVAADLGDAELGSSLVSTLVQSLIACPAVEELYADDEDVKELIEEMGRPRR